MSVSMDDIKYVSSLARLEFSESEGRELKGYLDRILKYISRLDELDAEDEEELVNPYYMKCKFREDVVEESLNIDDVIGNSPKHIENYIVVPRIME